MGIVTTSEDQFVILEIQDKIATITINNLPMNPLSKGVMDGIEDAFNRLEKEEDLRVIIITGAGEKAFVAGADIKEFPTWTVNMAIEKTARGQRLFQRIEEFPVPTIAAIGGYALGGGLELALACDIRIASENAKMGLPEVTLGIIPGYGGTQRLSRSIGAGQAKKMVYTGEMINAEKALAIGLVQNVVKREELIDYVRGVAEKIAANAPIAVRCAKRAINDERLLSISHGIAVELEGAAMVFASEDRTIGIDAFINKERPTFCNR